MNKKAQSAIEFMIIIGAVMLFFVGFFVSIQENISDKTKENVDKAVQEIALTVQDETALALKSSDGYSREFKLPLQAIGDDYNITINGNLVYVITKNSKHAIALQVANVTGQPKVGNNFIRRINGTIYIN